MSQEILEFLERETAKGQKGWLERLPDRGGAGTHPEIYRLYKEFVATGKYPYLDEVQVWITGLHPELPPFDSKFSGHTQPNPVQRQLQSEIYVAASQFRAEQKAATAARLVAEGFTALNQATIEPDRQYLLCMGDRPPVKVRPVFRDGKLFAFLPPRKRTHGWHAGALNAEKIVYVKSA